MKGESFYRHVKGWLFWAAFSISRARGLDVEQSFRVSSDAVARRAFR